MISARYRGVPPLLACALLAGLRWHGADAWIHPRAVAGSRVRALPPLFDKAPQHDVKSGQQAFDLLPPEQRERVRRFMEHQQSVPRIGFATDVRSLVQYNHGFAVMSTNSKANPGFPGGSVVGFAVDEDGRPLFVFSGMSSHTQDILADPRCSLTVADKNFKGAADGRVNLMGECTRLRDAADIEAARELYLAKHPGAFWVDFGDFNWFRMEVSSIRSRASMLLSPNKSSYTCSIAFRRARSGSWGVSPGLAP